MQQSTSVLENTLTERQKDVLDAALHLLVKGNVALTMSNIAHAASCSKETLYKWFGDRDSFLEAMVQWQASRVRVMPLNREALDSEALFSSLEHFARDWLMVLSSQTSIALNRLAVSHAASDKSRLGDIVLHNGPSAMARRLKPILQLGLELNFLHFDDIDNAFRTFFGLVVRDMQIRILLGDNLVMDDAHIIREARTATRQFFVLYGTEDIHLMKQSHF
ncbi:TetR/AcrR family transcriptional regulator [Bartonella sp. LJL80]